MGDRELVFCFVLFLFGIRYFFKTMEKNSIKKPGECFAINL